MNLRKEINKINILVFGDYMVDEYIDGIVTRISPEAPVPVLQVKSKTKKLGGAGNVTNNIISLGGNVTAIGRVGNDEYGNYIKYYFTKNNVNNDYLYCDDDYKTIVKTRVVSKNQQFIRIDEEEKVDISKGILDKINKNLDKILNNINVIIISDYAKGSITKNSISELIKIANKKNIPVIIDPKGNDYTKYKNATLCTPNMKELSDIAGYQITTEEEILKESLKVIKENKLDYLILTRSEKGITLVDNKGNKKDFPALKKEVVDVSGAGDTVVATIAIFIALNYKIEQVCILSNMTASIVVSKFGTSTVDIEELENILSKKEDKIIEVKDIDNIVKKLRKENKKIVFTNGCFDLLHTGHLSSFKKAKSFGDVLFVGVNSNNSVKTNKGDLRPIIDEEDRLRMLNEVNDIDYLILMDDKTPEKLINLIKPDVSVKGEDWKNKYVPEKELIESYGGKIEFIELEKGKSTTNIINKILKAYNGE